MQSARKRIDGLLVVGGMAHDFDFVRLELLKLLSEDERLRITVTPDFENLAALDHATFVISYTCNIKPSDAAQSALRDAVAQGKRWFALHATNALLDWTPDGVDVSKDAPMFMDTVGSQFVAHPPLGPFQVVISDPVDPLMQGIKSFTVTDELYLADYTTDVRVLMHTVFQGEAPGFVRADWTGEPATHPVLYERTLGQGSVLYYTLGHARGHYDAPHRTPYYPQVERCAWDEPTHYEILRRGIAWAKAPALAA